MAAELQALAQGLAARLQRAVAIDDPRMHLLAHTPHDGPVDAARLDSILRLQPPPEDVAWVMQHGIARAQAPLRLPGRDVPEFLPRVCAPIRCHDELLGYVWVIDADQSLTDDDLAVMAAVADSAGLVLYRDQLLDDLQRSRQRELLRDLLNNDLAVRRAAADALLAEEHFVAGSGVVALVMLVRGEGQADRAVAVEAALERAARRFAPQSCLYLARADQGVLLAADRKGALHHGDISGLAAAVQHDISQHVDGEVYVGVGSPARALAGALDSYDQARRAIRVAEIVPGFGPAVSWQDLGVYRVLVQLPLETLPPDVIHPALLTLFEQDTSGQLVHTLETYLDAACDVRRTIEALAVHRTSLYYRLNRIQAVSGLRLDDGGERLTVHLGLKLARLAGRHPHSQRDAVDDGR